MTNNQSLPRKTLLGFAVVAPFLTVALLEKNVLVALAPLFVSHLLLLYATLVPNCTWWGPVVRSFHTSEREVWLTIDDGPCIAHTEKILDLLDQFEARATFFVIGSQAEAHPHLVTEILARGQALANHTFQHPSRGFWRFSARAIAREIDRCAETLRIRPDRPQLFFRSPAGLKNPFVHPILFARGLVLVGWTVRGFDTLLRDPAAVAERVARRIRPGAIIVLHEGHRVQRDPEFNLRCIELTLRRATQKNYRFVIPREEQLNFSGKRKGDY
ncbi:MAG: polysaccharide deacetylase family protein [Chthoniobacterales bacterium]